MGTINAWHTLNTMGFQGLAIEPLNHMTKIDQTGQWLLFRGNRFRLKLVFFAAVLIVLGTMATVSNVVGQSDRSGPDPVELLREMTNSIEKLSYEGTFVYLADGQVETMKIMHTNDGGATNEYLTSLNGEAREVFRDDSLVTCIWPTSKMTISLKSKKHNLSSNFDFTLQGNDNYQFITSPDDRVAGRDTYVINVKSKDNYRYSYKFWIDIDTKMLLRSISLDGNNRPMEQVMFTDIRFSDDIIIEDVNAKIAHLNYTNQPYQEATDLSTTEPSPIRFESLPDGYTRVNESIQPRTADNGSIHHISLSDGMASVSVFVEIEYTPTELNSIGLSTLGGIAAYSLKLGSAYATVIGEVPVETVRKIAQAVKLDSVKPE